MRNLVWSNTFVRACKRVAKRKPGFQTKIERSLALLTEDPYHPSLHSHKLKGELAGVWACTVDFNHRILYEFVNNPESGVEEIYLLTIGTHEEVY
ncbi:MAG: type II toxin-antitoxin system YafQ family toxin [Anaerolineales bacterium]